VAYVSAAYDLLLAVPLLLAPAATARLFGLGPPAPLVNAQLNGLFTLALAAGYLWAARDLEHRRGFLWIAGVLVKGAGAGLFLADHLLRQSPPLLLAFAASDGTLALLTLAVLLATRRPATPA